MEKHSRLGGVIIVPIDDRTGGFVLVTDPSKSKPHYLKFPGGKIKPTDASPEAAAARELWEETTLVAKNLIHFGVGSNSTQYLFLALVDFPTSNRP